MGCGIINYQRACVIGHGFIAVKHAMQGKKTLHPAECLTQKHTQLTESERVFVCSSRTTVTKPCRHMPQKYELLLSYTTLCSHPTLFHFCGELS